MASARPRPLARDPTPKQWKFAEARLSGLTLVDAYVAAYPARRGPRSREGERVKAKRLAKNPAVVWAMQQIAERRAEEDAVENPEQVRKECLIALRRIRQGRLDSSYARAVMAELREANREIERKEERIREQQRAQRDARERAARQQLDQLLKVMGTLEATKNTAGATAAKTSSTGGALPPQITPSVPAHDPPPKSVVTPTPPAPPGTERDDELQHYVRQQQAARKAAAAENPPQLERRYLPGHFPPKLWIAGDSPRLRATTLPTFSAHRTGKEVPMLMVIHERWGADAGATDRRKRKEPREPYY
jgi:hypothetical protein